MCVLLIKRRKWSHYYCIIAVCLLGLIFHAQVWGGGQREKIKGDPDLNLSGTTCAGGTSGKTELVP